MTHLGVALLFFLIAVHFDVPKQEHENAADAILESAEPDEEKSMEDSMMEVVQAQKRILDQWCFAEHYEAGVLMQVNSC